MGVERRAGDSAAARYRPRRPSQSVLYRCVQQHFETWLAQCRDGHDDEWSVPEYVEREFRRYLDCGILARGFTRACCDACGHDFLIAFSCQGRAVCPRATPGLSVGATAHDTSSKTTLPPKHIFTDSLAVLTVPKRIGLKSNRRLSGVLIKLSLITSSDVSTHLRPD